MRKHRLPPVNECTASVAASLLPKLFVAPVCCILLALTPADLHAQVTATGDYTPAPFVSPTWDVGSGLTVGNTTNGTLSISNTGSVSSQGGIIGNQAGTVGTVNLSGGSWSATADGFRTLTIGRSGNGTLNLSGGTLTTGGSYMAFIAGSTGLLEATGGNWTNTDFLAVGHRGSATMNISAGRIESRYVSLGSTATGTGEINVTGGNLVATPLADVFARDPFLDGAIQVGNINTGTMTVSGGNVRSDRVFIGLSNGATGVVTMSGGVWDSSGVILSYSQPDTLEVGSIFVGYDGIGTFNMTGGQVIANSLKLFGGGSVANLSGGEMNLIDPGLLYASSGLLVVAGSTTLNLSGTALLTGALAVVDPGGTLNIIGGNFTLTPTQWSGSPQGAVLQINGGMTMSGGQATTTTFQIRSTTDISGGTLTAQNIEMLGFTGTFNLTGGVAKTAQFTGSGTINLNGGTVQVLTNQGAVFGTHSNTVNIGTNGATIDTQGFTVGNGGRSISGTGALTKLGSGTLTLTGTNTYGGGTAVAEGTLVVNGTIGNVSVTNGATLAGTGTVGIISLNGGTLAPGNSPGTLFASDLVWSGGTIEFELGPTQALSDLIDLSGQLSGTGSPYVFDFLANGTAAGATYDLIQFSDSLIAIDDFIYSNTNGLTGTFAYAGGNTLQFTVNTVPEPGTVALLAAAASLLAWHRLRSRRRS